MSTDIALREDPEAAGLALAEQQFTPERREAIARFLNITADDPALPVLLAISAQTGLSPLIGELWLIPVKVKVVDGAGRQQDKWVLRPTAGRDGFLKVARRNHDYQGMLHDVVCANDTFQVKRKINVASGEVEFEIIHEYPELQAARHGMAEVAAAKAKAAGQDGPQSVDSRAYRGPVIGAYAIAYFKGKKPTYYFADIREHGKAYDDGNWKGAWSYVAAMILKSAQSYVLRIASGISGIVPADEVSDRPQLTAPDRDPLLELIEELDASPSLKARVRALVEKANAASPNRWTEANLQMKLAGHDETALELLVAEMEHEADELTAANAEEVTAEIVDDPAEALRHELNTDPLADAAEVPAAKEEDVPAGGAPSITEQMATLYRRRENLADQLSEERPGSDEFEQLSAELDAVEQQIEQSATGEDA